MNWRTPKEIELDSRIDEIDSCLFLLNSGVSESAVRSGLLERRREWVKQRDWKLTAKGQQAAQRRPAGSEAGKGGRSGWATAAVRAGQAGEGGRR